MLGQTPRVKGKRTELGCLRNVLVLTNPEEIMLWRTKTCEFIEPLLCKALFWDLLDVQRNINHRLRQGANNNPEKITTKKRREENQAGN